MSDPVAAIYDRWADYQWGRLDGRLCELHVHLAAVTRRLPPGSRVLDLGAGPGRYAVELARRGYRVWAGDLSPRQVEIARCRAAAVAGVEEVALLDARDLSRFPGAAFDGVLALGPFYHLKQEAERQQAAAEAARVLRPGGALFAAFMPRAFWLSRTLAELARNPGLPPAYLTHLEAFWESGHLDRLRSDQVKQSYFCRLEEIVPLFAGAGIRQEALLASQSVAAAWSDEAAWESLARRGLLARVLDLLLAAAAEPGVLAMSDQVLFVGVKQRTGEKP